MAIHEWRKRPTSFGEVWVPCAQIELLGIDRRFHSFVLQIDSGAVISLVKKSVADLLGIPIHLDRCRKLTAVGGGKTSVYVHTIDTKFDDNLVLPVPIAFAATENVPNLLGRLGVFDQLFISFNPILKQTEIELPPQHDVVAREGLRG